MSHIIDKLKSGDLITVAYTNSTYPAIFHRATSVSVQFFFINSERANSFRKNGVGATYKNYINSWDNPYRVVKITEDSLTDGNLDIYKEMKEIYDAFSLQS
jgi:hypothetical protein